LFGLETIVAWQAIDLAEEIHLDLNGLDQFRAAKSMQRLQG
jgi:hypothetical protein